MKTYSGYRLHDAAGRAVQAVVMVHEPGCEPRPLDPRLDLRNHSPTGFEWGYAGSGPAQLALALTADALGDEHAQRVYQGFKFKVVGRLPQDGWILTEEQLRQAVRDIERSKGDRSP